MKYRYTVCFSITGQSACVHAEEFGNAPAAMAAARAVYAALQSVLEPERDTLPSFHMIRLSYCRREKLEPRNKAFSVSVAKEAR